MTTRTPAEAKAKITKPKATKAATSPKKTRSKKSVNIPAEAATEETKS